MKYRVWDKVEKKFTKDITVDQEGNLILTLNEENFPFGFRSLSEERYIISECSGFKDKNGKDIYNGDIISYRYYGKNNLYEVVYDGKEWNLCNRVEKVLISDVFKIRLKIAGNIYENSKLLEGKWQKNFC